MPRALVVVILIVLLPAHALAEARIALLIGNQAYADAVGPLKNPHNDIARVGQALSEVGFTVLDPLKDASRDDMLFGVYKLAERLRNAGPGAVGFLYYTGHGIAVGGENVLIPKNVESTSDAELSVRGVRLSEVLDILKNNAPDAVHFVVLDACRNNIRGQKGAKGFVPINDQRAGVVLAFATAAGETASDDGVGSGPYAAALAEEIVVPGRNDQAVFNAVRRRVAAATARHQTPWTHDGLIGERIVFKEAAAVTPPPVATASTATSNIETLMRTCVKEELHPNGAEIAARLARTLQQGRFEYGWRDVDHSSGKVEIFAYDIRSVSSDVDELRIGYQWQNGSLRVRVVAPLARATRSIRPIAKAGPAGVPGTDLQGIWLQDNGFGCVHLRLTDTGEGSGMWSVRSGPLDAELFLRSKKLASVESPAHCDGVETQVGSEKRCLKPKDVFRDCENCPEMVVVPSGSFTMGSPANEPDRSSDEVRVRVSIAAPFAAGKYAVSFDEWDACVADGGCNGYKPSDQGWGRGKHPVINVNWNDANVYAAWLLRKTGKNYRLLSEAEREYVTRAGTTTPFWWGSSITPKQANYRPNDSEGEFRQRTVPVDSFEPNPWGLYNVHGNVWEWTEDCWNGSNAGNPGDGRARTTGDCRSRMIRGGHWGISFRASRSATRFSIDAVSRYGTIGLRLARTLAP